jgi:hypothetical protein
MNYQISPFLLQTGLFGIYFILNGLFDRIPLPSDLKTFVVILMRNICNSV